MFDQLLLAIDESPAAAAATDFGAALSRQCAATVPVGYANGRLPGPPRPTPPPPGGARPPGETGLGAL